MYKILIIGSGGREHALAWKMAQSDLCDKIFVAPGNGGSQEIATNLNIDPLDFKAVAECINTKGINMLVIGPEAPLVAGMYDYFKNNKGLIVIGPSQEASQLEGSKAFANAFMADYNIPTASSHNFNLETLQAGLDHISNSPSPYVLKADGLAAGKGVLIINDKLEAQEALRDMLNGKFGAASNTVVIEQFLDGIEFSMFALTDGKDYVLLPAAKDYKRIGEGDTGLNTGGMGAISPVSFLDQTLLEKVEKRIIKPTIDGLAARGFEYKGFVFFGIINVDNEPYVIEYNCRLGDPETEVILPRLDHDLVALFASIYDGTLSSQKVSFSNKSAATVMLVSGGYPESYEKGKQITFEEKLDNSLIFHAGTKVENGQCFTNGGRVIAVTTLSSDFQSAVKESIANCKKINFDKKYYRTDIGSDL